MARRYRQELTKCGSLANQINFGVSSSPFARFWQNNWTDMRLLATVYLGAVHNCKQFYTY